MNYFLSIVLRGDNGQYIYRLAKGINIKTARVICDISRRGAVQWFKEHKRRFIYSGVRSNFFAEEGENKPTVLFVNRAYQFYENNPKK